MKHFVTWSALLIFTLFPSMAMSDIATPEPETCLMERFETAGNDCEQCDASFEDTEACSNRYNNSDFALQCRSQGASYWYEIWCSGQVTEKPRKTSDGCSTGVPSLLFLGFLGILWRSRK